jgi:hypothetical protein
MGTDATSLIIISGARAVRNLALETKRANVIATIGSFLVRWQFRQGSEYSFVAAFSSDNGDERTPFEAPRLECDTPLINALSPNIHIPLPLLAPELLSQTKLEPDLELKSLGHRREFF